jgi:hypothetical protein
MEPPREADQKRGAEKKVLAKTRWRLAAIPACATPLVAASLSVGVTSADPVPAEECGAHTEALDCIRDMSPPNPAEQHLLTTVGPHFPNVSNAVMVQYARGTCGMLRGGAATWYVVKALAERLGTTMQAADQVMDAAMAADCPSLKVGLDGVAR